MHLWRWSQLPKPRIPLIVSSSYMKWEKKFKEKFITLSVFFKWLNNPKWARGLIRAKLSNLLKNIKILYCICLYSKIMFYLLFKKIKRGQWIEVFKLPGKWSDFWWTYKKSVFPNMPNRAKVTLISLNSGKKRSVYIKGFCSIQWHERLFYTYRFTFFPTKKLKTEISISNSILYRRKSNNYRKNCRFQSNLLFLLLLVSQWPQFNVHCSSGLNYYAVISANFWS